MLVLEHYGMTDPGKVRKNNEDSLLTGEGRNETLFVVADGIGGFEAGEVASSIAVDVLKELPPSESLETAIKEANRRILAASRGDDKLSGMGTTVVAVRFGEKNGEPVVEVSHVGDSRAYLVRGGELKPVTEDHSLVAELVRSGDLTRAQASEHPQKNLITRALGAEDTVEVDTAVLPVEPEDRFVLCSDGLTDMVPETKLQEILTSSPDPEKAARTLVGAALDAGGADNVTVVIIDVSEEEPPPPERRPRGGTQEMRALSPERSTGGSTSSGSGEGKETRSRNVARSKKKRTKSGRLGQVLGSLVRAVAVVLVVAALLTPFYLWSSSRYFLGFDEEEVVIYRGLPYAPFGYALNREVQRTGLLQSDIQTRYQDDVEKHNLYPSEGEAENVVSDLREEGR
ncbi:MAG: Protein serine/threonine phosphatase PrpC, regulation of stationary phase [uncultured Rubrobacteraceae bacterium]|uniref:Protein serine/threonine phosphatase PrpC, regulation of stationary phase n=1 Tax=uncultured Rubrobacteraceae bacterium TaxID=349277 RepID=A0A6J4QYW3_9ACTN|nr:MAG: Protein serine/threonine phosphatase PrpC, regulation of stationary phase [uncultured Rubrobacteraceae bacterium]